MGEFFLTILYYYITIKKLKIMARYFAPQFYVLSDDKTVIVNTAKNIVAHVNEEKETWRPIATEIPCFMSYGIYKIKPIYEVSNFGRIRNKNTKKIISMRYSPDTGTVKMNLLSETWLGYSSLCFSPARVIFATYYPEAANKANALAFSKIKFKDGHRFNFSPDNLYMMKEGK